ncbi:LacI family DNA-binding transcriptional regulator [Arthrobacter sp. Hiyo1]|uniref:LacI family DNA-binding transcriptional regulator n=1 Tax=Arthrobacter sp. Hiyo1 TaxID=1588020 RepID=UPI00209BDA2D|nr:helix-turn-helix domain-containing protein [Arthrobacter sp. Hiyo1]
MTVTINDVAQAAGVSKGAVSYALNGQPGVSDDTRERILRVARELGGSRIFEPRACLLPKPSPSDSWWQGTPGFWELTPSSPHSSPGSRPPWSSTNTSWS